MIAHAAALESRVPFLHFFDGFRTSHEISKVEEVTAEDVRALIDDKTVRAHRERALSSDHPFVRGTAQNPDVFFQAQEAVNPYYRACPTIVQDVMDRFAKIVGRAYHLFDYVGAPDADRVIVMMGSGAEAAQEAVEHLVAQGEKVGLVKVRLYRPFSIEHFLAALPRSVKTIAALDRTKEAGSVGEPLYLDVMAALMENAGSAGPARNAAPDRRPLRAFVQGIYAGHGERNFRRDVEAESENAFYDRNSRRRFAHQPRLRPGFFNRRSPGGARRSFTAWARTARSAPTRIPSRSSAKTRKTTPRVTLFTTPRNRARSRSRICALGRNPSTPPI